MKHQRVEGLVLGARRDALVDRKMFKKPANLDFAHLSRMAFPIEKNELSGPVHVSLFGAG